LLASNVDDATDGDSTINGYVRFDKGLVATSNGGNITLGGGNLTGTSYAMGSSNAATTEGIRIDVRANITSGGGNISMRGKSYAVAVPWATGGSGLGFYNLTQAGVIDSGTGTVYLDGYSQTWGSSYSSGFNLYNNTSFTIKSANTTANAIQLIATATGTSGDSFGLEVESSPLAILATGVGLTADTGGGITIKTSTQYAYDAVYRSATDILAKKGPINLLGRQGTGIANTYWYDYAAFNIGSKAGSADVPTSSSDITLKFDKLSFSVYPSLATTGKIVWAPTDQSTSFGQAMYASYFTWNQNGLTPSSITIGKDGMTSDVNLDRALTANGPITVYGGNLVVSTSLTSSGTSAAQGIYLKATGNITSNGDVNYTTNGGDITFWSDSDASGAGYIYIQDRNNLDSRTNANRTSALISTASGGGTITLGGGNTSTTLASGTVVPTGFAVDNTSSVPGGVTLGYFNVGHVSGINLYSGGGNIAVRGKTTSSWSSSSDGIATLEGLTMDAGASGNITLVGEGA